MSSIKRPEHELPDNIRSMNRDETVCKFCGISYLIHNEVKRLQDKMAIMEKEMEQYRGSVEREKVLQKTSAELQSLVDTEKQANQVNNALVAALSSETKKLRADNADHANQMTAQIAVVSKQETRLGDLCGGVHTLKTECTTLQRDFVEARGEIQSELSLFCEGLSEYQRHVESYLNYELEKILMANQQLSKASCATSAETAALKQEMLVKDNELRSLQAEVASLRDFEANVSTLKGDNDVLAAKLKTLKRENSELVNKVENERSGAVHARNTFDETHARVKFLESRVDEYEKRFDIVDELKRQAERDVDQLRQREEHFKVEIDTLRRGLDERDLSAQDKNVSLLSTIASLKEEISQSHSDMETAQRQIDRTSKEAAERVESFKRSVRKADEELQSLKLQRDETLALHHSQLEQVREHFRKQIAEARDVTKQSTLSERENQLRHTAKLQAQLRADHKLELQIERDKHRELLERYDEKVAQEREKIRRSFESAEEDQKNMIERCIGTSTFTQGLQLKLELRDAEMEKADKKWRDETNSLNSTIRTLQGNVASEMVRREEHGASSVEMSKLRRDLDRNEQLYNTLKQQLAEATETVESLQETVQSECEERFDLTSQLSDAQHQIKLLKKKNSTVNS